MSSNAAEQELGRWLRSLPDTWVHHPVDHPKARYWKPADFVVCRTGFMFLIESKEVATGPRFPLSNWTAQQRNTAVAVARDGKATYVLCVHFKQLKYRVLYEVGLDVMADDSGSLLATEKGGGMIIEDADDLATWMAYAVSFKRFELVGPRSSDGLEK